MSKSTDTKEISVAHLLQTSRDNISQGNMQGALSAVIRAIVATSGEASVLKVLDAANAKAKSEKEREIRNAMRKCCEDLINQDTLLSEMGDEEILIDAFQDGSSVVCQRCGGLVAVERAEAHSLYWCDALEAEDDS